MSRSAPRSVRSALACLATLLTLLLLSATASARMLVGRIVLDHESKATERMLSARMHLYPGDRVDYEVLANAAQRLIESDLFVSARVYIDVPEADATRRMFIDDCDSYVDVRVNVVDKTSWFIVPTASIGSGDRAIGVAYGDQNLLGHDLQVLGAAQLGQSRSYVFGAFRDPLVVGAPLTWELSGLYRFEKFRFFTNHQLALEVPTMIGGGEADLGWVLSPHLRALGGFSARYQQVRAADFVSPDAAPIAYNAASGRVFLLVFQVRFDNTVAPEGLREGARLLLKNEISDRYWGSQFDYSKFEVRAELYGHFGWNYPSITLQTVFDSPTSTHGVPVTETLRVGGSNLRGYLVNEFHGDTLVAMQSEDQVVALRGLPLPFVDTRFNVALAGFIDAAALLERHPGGTSADLAIQARPKLADFHTSVGAGFRIILPGVAIPALKADLGYGIDVRSYAITVSVGGGG